MRFSILNPPSRQSTIVMHMHSGVWRRVVKRVFAGSLIKKDARSTGNMRKHAKVCWGDEVLKAADDAKNAEEVRTKIVASVLRNGSITASFERKGKGRVTYSHRQHTKSETRWVIELRVAWDANS